MQGAKSWELPLWVIETRKTGARKPGRGVGRQAFLHLYPTPRVRALRRQSSSSAQVLSLGEGIALPDQGLGFGDREDATPDGQGGTAGEPLYLLQPAACSVQRASRGERKAAADGRPHAWDVKFRANPSRLVRGRPERWARAPKHVAYWKVRR